jgi:hypothetical protein
MADLLVVAFLANGAGHVTDIKQVGVYRCPAEIGLRATLRASSSHRSI